MNTQDEINRLAEFEDQLRYVYENIATVVCAFDSCKCAPADGITACEYCSSKHFIEWYQSQPEFKEELK